MLVDHKSKTVSHQIQLQAWDVLYKRAFYTQLRLLLQPYIFEWSIYSILGSMREIYAAIKSISPFLHDFSALEASGLFYNRVQKAGASDSYQ